MSSAVCQKCGAEFSIKDNGIWSSALCACEIKIYYYESHSLRCVTKIDWLESKKREAERLSKKLEAVR